MALHEPDRVRFNTNTSPVLRLTNECAAEDDSAVPTGLLCNLFEISAIRLVSTTHIV